MTDQANEPRYPSFKGIMAAKKKPVADLVAGRPRRSTPARWGCERAWTKVVDVRRPVRRAAPGTIVTDEDGSGADQLVEFLAGQKFI